MNRIRLCPAPGLLAFLVPGSCISAEEPLWRAGVARTRITPTEAMWMAGYGNRTRPAEGKATDLWLKALALEAAGGRRAVLVTSDLLGIPQSIYRHTCRAVQEKFGLAPEQLILSASHTHCGPVLRGALYDIYPLDDAQRALVEAYSAQLEGHHAMIVYGLPAHRWADDVEDLITASARRLVNQVNAP